MLAQHPRSGHAKAGWAISKTLVYEIAPQEVQDGDVTRWRLGVRPAAGGRRRGVSARRRTARSRQGLAEARNGPARVTLAPPRASPVAAPAAGLADDGGLVWEGCGGTEAAVSWAGWVPSRQPDGRSERDGALRTSLLEALIGSSR